MNQIPASQQLYNYGTPLTYYNNGATVATNNGQQGTVSVSTPNSAPMIYNYPTTSIYDPASKQATSGVNIHIYNPSGIGGPSSNSVANATYALPNTATQPNVVPQPVASQSLQDTGDKSFAPQQNVSIANTPLNSENSNQKTKKIVELTDGYIKSIENYLRSNDKAVRKAGIVDLVQRFEEDSSRYDDPALNALLNIALQDPKPDNRMLAMAVISAEKAHGNKDTLPILQNLQKSTAMYGQEAEMATECILKVAQNKVEVVDKDPPRYRAKD